MEKESILLGDALNEVGVSRAVVGALLRALAHRGLQVAPADDWAWAVAEEARTRQSKRTVV